MSKLTKEKETILDIMTALRTRIIDSIGIRNVVVKTDSEIADQSGSHTFHSDWEDITFSLSIKDHKPKKVKATLNLYNMDKDKYSHLFQGIEEYLSNKNINFYFGIVEDE